METTPAVICACFLVAIGLAVYLWLRHKNVRPPRPQRGPAKIHFFEPKPRDILAELRQNLRVKVGWDEARIDRLIDLEREKMPSAPLRRLMESAIERWERDNR